ncbi:ABC transporter ATP-binding protein [Clostridium sp. BSD9I1]|uniref:ABC transporter ATP-binding protein n=1 Tax=Clostridium sp. BSD9I1 TaxID=2003589 RepID=UPI001647F3B2|nr:ABC transporter ATP-binding protein [Clostridium sp. BSD9I1]
MPTENCFSLIVKDLNYGYGNKNILHNINLEFTKGKFYTILGPNGSGKTTLLKNISRAVPVSNKKVYIDNNDINSLSSKDLAQNLASVPQNTNIDFEFTALDIVMMGRAPYLKRFQNEQERDFKIVEDCMKMTNTWELKDKNINELSGGERQRVIIARALAQDTDILLLDEPISNLDIQHQIEILDTIKFLSKDITVITILHDLNLAAEYSDSLILLKDGYIKAHGSVETVFTEKNLEEVYNMHVCLIKNPITGKPHVLPVSKNIAKQHKAANS